MKIPFLNNLKETNFDLPTNDLNENYRFITDTLIKIFELKHLWKRDLSEEIKPFIWARNWEKWYTLEVG